MEHLKNLAMGLFGLVVAVVMFAILVIGLVAVLQTNDWLELNHPALRAPLGYSFAAGFVAVVLWLLGRAIRREATRHAD